MAVAGKRLFWTSIIIVELVLVYLLWKPYRDRAKPVHRAAVTAPAVMRAPEAKAAPIVIPSINPSSKPSSKPWSGVQHSAFAAHRKPPVVSAALKSPEPLTAKIVPQPAPTVAPADSFWCRISANVDAKCDCKDKGQEQASNLVMRSGSN
jgi:hypothetical protein